MVAGRTSSSGIPYWPVDTVLSIQLLTQFVDRLERRCSNRAAEESVYARLMRACGISGALEQGRRVHGHVQRHADDRSLFFGNRLVNMYRRCSSLDEARKVFDRMRERDVVSWTAMISAYAQTGHQRQALDLFTEMAGSSLDPNRVTFLALLEACDSPEFLEDGKQIHARVSALQLLESDVPVANAVMGMYRKCERADLAMAVFSEMRERDLISWNNAIAANAESGDYTFTLALLKSMQLEGMAPDKVTFVSALNACIGSRSLSNGRLIHALVLERGMEGDVVLGTALVTMYGRCGCLESAREIFHRMPERNVVSWNAMVASCTLNAHFAEAIELFKRMVAVAMVEPTRVSFITVLNAVTTPEALAEGRRIHAMIQERQLLSQIEVANALVTMYGRCGGVGDAERVFSAMERRDLVSWNAMISAYAQSGLAREVVNLFHRMRAERVPPDRITFLMALDACAEIRDLDSGRTVHHLSVESGFGSCISVANATMHLYSSCSSSSSSSSSLMEVVAGIFESMAARDVISWNTMITGYVQAGDSFSALSIFKRMLLEGIRGNQVTFMSLLSVCDSRAFLRQGETIHRRVINQTPELSSDPIVAAAIVNMYGKCGELDTARHLFEDTSHRNLASWNSMISAYALHGRAEQAFDLSERMRREGVLPDRVTFITLLNACVAGGAVRHGKMIHARIIDSGLEKDTVVANALVNFYSKCGNLDTATSLFGALDYRDVVSWNGIIAGFAHNGHAREALKSMWLMQQDGVRPDAITFLTILSASSHAGFLRQGGDDFVSMAVDHELERGVEHYGCMIDLLGRAGRIGDAEYFVSAMRDEDKEVSWMTLLSACEVHGDEERAKRVAGSIVEMNPQHSSAYVALSNLYATCGDGSFRFKRPRLKKSLLAKSSSG
ncbi:pentatricopeptide repeat-containing protein At5g27110 [Selaginella moellendorffii]|nr:pentatricopeptide repeat-containing protein At5g27110 [Selaginella moellendorffii]|eukprot:XP_002981045.2 pentatricopeptide repeat-containing protein At5g27110 [Selaginella moellendorffii]